MSRSSSEISDGGESVTSSVDDCNRCGVGGAGGSEDAALTALSTTSTGAVILFVFAAPTAMAEVKEEEMTTLSRD